MIPAWFARTALDAAFYDARIAPRLPAKITDAHLHVYLPKHVENVTDADRAGDWASQCGFAMDAADARELWRTMFPTCEASLVALPTVSPKGDTPEANAYLAREVLASPGGGMAALMAVRPEWDAGFCEKTLVEGNFKGYKPYPYMASPVKGDEISIFDFLPPAQLDVLAKHKGALLLHLPRAGRLADDDNVAELKRIVDGWPDLRVVVAHYGRSYTLGVFERGVGKLGDYACALYWDCAAVLNPAVHAAAFASLDRKRIVYGTDLPVFTWHGRRRWDGDRYFNLCREEFPWNRHEEGEAAEEGYVFFLYEQVAAILDAVEAAGDTELADDLFYRNASRVYAL